jgi:hypothetical protein
MVAVGPGRLPGQDVDDHVGRVDAFGRYLRAGRFGRRQSVAQHGGQDGDHLSVAIFGAGEAPAHAIQCSRKDPVSERRTVAQCASLAGQHRHVVLFDTAAASA